MNTFVMRLTQICEFICHNGLSSLLHEVNYRNRVAVVIEKNLIEYDGIAQAPENSTIKFMELRPEILNGYQYPVKNRYLKALNYLKKSYGGFAIARGSCIIGDIWCTKPTKDQSPTDHPDCKWLQIRLAADQVYTFDMFLSPEERGSNLAAFLQNSALKALSKKGFTKAYGYYWGDNMPALWVHRMGKWKEVGRLKVNRYFFVKKVVI